MQKCMLRCLITFLCLSVNIFSQENYFQQEVNYKINVTLNDVSHSLKAFEQIEYVNNSTTPLTFIYFHLWPNAYKNNQTALAKQLLTNGVTKMYYAKSEDLGFIDSLNFRVDDKLVKWEYDKEHIDICKLILNQPLNPNDTIIISTPFYVKLPSANISRLGHINQAYAITQWYPKPAVFDKQGWHQMPYLNQGEFFSEFGKFEVDITLPKNYVLAATGDRLNEDEEEYWLNENVEKTKQMIANQKFETDLNFPASDLELKTISFKQSRVHDFAWFADKRFHVLKGEINLPQSKRKVTTWAYFTNNESKLWSKSIEYLNDATTFYSALNGDYPYNHVTAIDGTISAGGGMEYPNITIIGESNSDLTLETTIMHEVGHNWFYGILGSNEREFPMLDEGLNSFYEMRYLQSKYPKNKLTSLIDRDSTFRFFGLNTFKHKAEYEFLYLLAARKNTDQPISSSADKFTEFNYGAIVYSKTALAIDYLMNYMGQEKFDKAMRFYFEQWKFKHPSPNDLFNCLKYHSNSDLNWFTNDLLSTNYKIDYKLVSSKLLPNKSHHIIVKNNNTLVSPFSVSGFKDHQLIGTIWSDGFKGKHILEFPPSDIDYFMIDANQIIPEINRKNNLLKTKGVFKKTHPFQFNFIGKLDDPNYLQLNYVPVFGYNQYNKLMLGCAIYNYSLLQKPTEFSIAPMFAFGSKTPVGYADVTKHLTQHNKLFQEINLIGKIKTFSHNVVETNNFNEVHHTSISAFNLNYYKISATIEFELKKRNPLSKLTQFVSYSTNHLWVDELYVPQNSIVASLGKKNNYTVINRFQYILRNKQIIYPYNISLQLDHNDKFAKTSVELNYSISIKKGNSLDFRMFLGAFVYGNTQSKIPYQFRMNGMTGSQDYLFDYNYVGRNETNGIGFAQFTENDGAFKVWTPLGQTSKWLVALNIKSPKIAQLPIKLFLDLGSSEFNESLMNERVLYAAGINVSIFKNYFEIYAPLVYSKDIKNVLKANNKDGFFDTMRFTLNLHNIKPKKIIETNFF